MNGDPATLAWISLAVAILSLATAVVGTGTLSNLVQPHRPDDRVVPLASSD